MVPCSAMVGGMRAGQAPPPPVSMLPRWERGASHRASSTDACPRSWVPAEGCRQHPCRGTLSGATLHAQAMPSARTLLEATMTVGGPVTDLDTPALLVDLDILESNIARMIGT